MYSIDFTPINQIESVETDWRELFKGNEMTYFQSPDWLCQFIDGQPVEAESGFWTVRKKGVAVIIAPLSIVAKGRNRGVWLIGCRSFTDFSNFIYSEFDSQAVDYLFKHIKAKYGSMLWHFEDIKCNTELYRYLKSVKMKKIGDERQTRCGALLLSDNFENYFSSLGKSTRQNIRTARNRLAKANIEMEFCVDDKRQDAACQCAEIRRLWRVQHCEKISMKKKLLFMLRNLFRKHSSLHFPAFVPIGIDPGSKLMTLRLKNSGELAAFFCYGMDLWHKEVVVMAAGVNQTYTFYSPGMLCVVEFVEHMIEQAVIKNIDFTRGGESYKFHLGCKEYFTSTLVFKI